MIAKTNLTRYKYYFKWRQSVINYIKLFFQHSLGYTYCHLLIGYLEGNSEEAEEPEEKKEVKKN